MAGTVTITEQELRKATKALLKINKVRHKDLFNTCLWLKLRHQQMIKRIEMRNKNKSKFTKKKQLQRS